MIRLATLVAAAAAVAALALAGSSGAVTHPKLIGVVGKNEAFKITLKFNGTLVKTLKAGTYTVVIHDYSSSHSYKLTGPNGQAQKFTTPAFVGTKTFTVKFVAGKYKVFCVPHKSDMFQNFTVK